MDKVMKKAVFSWWIFSLLAGCSLPAGYGELSSNLAHYEPPALYKHYARLQPTPEAEAGHDQAFREQIEEIKERKRRWEEAMGVVQGEDRFFRPDPDRFNALLPGATNPAQAGVLLSEPFSLADLEILVFLRNPGVKAAKRDLRATLESYNQAWNLDEILRQYMAFTEDLMTGIGPMKGREPVEMRFPFPGVTALKGEIVNQEVIASSESLEIARRSALTLARKSYWNLRYVLDAVRITEEVLRLLEHLEAVARTRYEVGKTSFQDVIKIQIQRDRLREEMNTLKERQRNLEVVILELVDLPPELTVGKPLALNAVRAVPNVERLYSLAMNRKQEIRRTKARIGKMERMIELAETRIYPDYSMNLSLYQDEAVSQVGTMRKKEPFSVTTTASMGAGLPRMPWFGSSDAYLRETRQRLEALRENLRQVETKTVRKVREGWFRLDRARREEALYALRVVNLSRAALEVSARGYETGKVSFADVIASYTNWLEANLALKRRLSDLGVARAELEEAVGGSWDQREPNDSSER